MKNQRSILHLILMMIVIGSFLFYVILHNFWPDWQWIYEPLHSTMEAVGSLAAIIMAILLFERKHEMYYGKFFLLAIGFLGMGLLSGFHAVSSLGRGFILLYSLANLVGGFGFALIWFPWFASDKDALWKKWFLWAIVLGSIFFGIWTLVARETLPMMVKNGKFTIPAVSINLLAGLFFLAGAGRLLLDFHRSQKMEFYLIACMATFLGMTGLMFKYSSIWSSTWWFWHFLRLTALLLVLKYLFYESRRRISDLRLALVEQKKAEENLSESEKKYRELVDNALVGVYKTNLKGDFLYVNKALLSILEFETAEELMANGVLTRYKNPKDREILIENLKRTSNIINFETILLTKNGRPQNILLSATFDGDTLSGMIIDVTGRKRAEEKLRETRSYLENLLDYANAPIIVWDPESKIIQFNHAFEHLTGYIANEVIGQELSMLFPKASRSESLEKIGHTLSGEYWESVEIPILRKDGDIRIALWNSANIYTGDGKTLLATIAQGQDITERKQSEEIVGRQRDELSAHAHILSAILVTKDFNERLKIILNEVITFLNVEFGTIHLLVADELVLTQWHGISNEFRSQVLSFPAKKPPDFLRELSIIHEHLDERGLMPEFAKREGFQAWASIPLTLPQRGEDQPAAGLGTIILGSRHYEALRVDEVKAFEAIANQLALAIDYARSYRQAEERMARLQTLRDIDKAIMQRHDLMEVLHVVLERVPKELGAYAAAISLFDEKQSKTKVFTMRLPNGTIIEEEWGKMNLVDTKVELKYLRRRCQNGKDSQSDLHERTSRGSGEAGNRRGIKDTGGRA